MDIRESVARPDSPLQIVETQGKSRVLDGNPQRSGSSGGDGLERGDTLKMLVPSPNVDRRRAGPPTGKFGIAADPIAANPIAANPQILRVASSKNNREESGEAVVLSV